MPHSAESLAMPKWSLKRSIWLFLGFVTIAVVGAAGMQLKWERDRTLEQGFIRSEAEARALADQADSVVHSADLILLGLSAQLDLQGPTPQELPILSALMHQYVAADPKFYAMSFFDENGDQVASSHALMAKPVNFSDRITFIQQKADTGPIKLVISAPLRTRDEKRTMIATIERRVNHPDGSFAGILSCGVSISALQATYSKIATGKFGVVNLINPSGAVLIHAPPTGITIDQNYTPPAASLLSKSEAQVTQINEISIFDNRHRIGTRVQTPIYGMTVQAVYDVDELLNPWVMQSGLEIGLLVVLGIGVVAFGFVILRQSQQREKSEALFRLLAERSTDILVCINSDGGMIYTSPSFWALTGWTPDTLKGQLTFNYIVNEDLPILLAGLQAIKLGKPNQPMRFRFQLPTGKAMWVEMLASMVADVLDLPVVFVCNVREITQQKQSETDLVTAHDSLALLTLTDALTELHNRRSFDIELENEWIRATRQSQPLALLMIDIDRFKSYNDTYGHLGGDTCLREVATIMATTLRRGGDYIARYGGEEFVVLLTNNDMDKAGIVAESLRLAVFQAGIAHSGNEAGVVTISIGVASIKPSHGVAMDYLIELADEAVYQAKEAGRNQVVFNSRGNAKASSNETSNANSG